MPPNPPILEAIVLLHRAVDLISAEAGASAVLHAMGTICGSVASVLRAQLEPRLEEVFDASSYERPARLADGTDLSAYEAHRTACLCLVCRNARELHPVLARGGR